MKETSDLANREIVDVAQYDGGALRGRQPLDGLQDRISAPLEQRLRPFGLSPQADEAPLATFCTAKVIGKSMPRDADDPRHEVGSTVVPLTAAEELGKGLLREVLGDLVVTPGAEQQVAVHARERRVVPRAERNLVAEKIAKVGDPSRCCSLSDHRGPRLGSHTVFA